VEVLKHLAALVVELLVDVNGPLFNELRSDQTTPNPTANLPRERGVSLRRGHCLLYEQKSILFRSLHVNSFGTHCYRCRNGIDAHRRFCSCSCSGAFKRIA